MTKSLADKLETAKKRLNDLTSGDADNLLKIRKAKKRVKRISRSIKSDQKRKEKILSYEKKHQEKLAKAKAEASKKESTDAAAS